MPRTPNWPRPEDEEDDAEDMRLHKQAEWEAHYKDMLPDWDASQFAAAWAYCKVERPSN